MHGADHGVVICLLSGLLGPLHPTPAALIFMLPTLSVLLLHLLALCLHCTVFHLVGLEL